MSSLGAWCQSTAPCATLSSLFAQKLTDPAHVGLPTGVAYRAKPATAAWIQRERKRLGLSTHALAERLATINAKVSEQTISVWESNADRRPSGYNLDALERIFGSQAPDKDATTDPVAAAIREQTAALRELTQELVSTNRARDAVVEALLAELAAYRRQTVESRVVEQSLLEALPGALATALGTMREDDPEDAPLETPPREALAQ